MLTMSARLLNIDVFMIYNAVSSMMKTKNWPRSLLNRLVILPLMFYTLMLCSEPVKHNI